MSHEMTTVASTGAEGRLGEDVRRLLVLAAPIVAAKVSHLALGFTDFVMLSWLGTDTTAAISPSTLFIFIVLCLGMGAVTSVQTLASQALGRREPHLAAGYTWQSIYIGLLFLVITWPLSTLIAPFWNYVGHPAVVRDMEIAYCDVAIWSMGLAIMCTGLESFFNGVQRPKVALVSVIVAIVLDGIGNYVLIFGKFGFPEMGIRGAAITTVMGWAIRVGIMLYVFLSAEYRREFRTHVGWRLNLSELRDIIRVGGPIGLQWFLDVGSWFVFLTWMMASFSTATLAASNIALQFMHISFMPALGIGVAVSSLVGHAIGEGRPDLAVRRARVGMILTGCYMGAVGLVFLLCRYPLMSLLSSDQAVIQAGAIVLIWAAIFQVFDATGINYMFALRGAGDTKWPAILVVFNCWVIFIGGGTLLTRLAPGLGLHGPWMMCTLYIILLGLALWVRWRRGYWKKIELFNQSPLERSAEEAALTMDAAGLAIATTAADASVCTEPMAATEPG